jgi:hypothetical protein
VSGTAHRDDTIMLSRARLFFDEYFVMPLALSRLHRRATQLTITE